MPPEMRYPELFGRPWALLDDDAGAGGGGGGSSGGMGDGGGAGGAGGTGEPAAGGTGTSSAGANGGGTTDDAAHLRSELEAVRKEAAKQRRELQTLRQANESAEEKRERELAEAREAASSSTSTVRALRVENAVLRIAGRMGIVDPDVAARIVELPEDAWTAEGELDRRKLEKALQELVRAKPFLVRQGSAAGGDGGAGDRQTGGTGGTMNDLIRSAAGRGSR